MSGDSVEALAKFRDKYELNFPLAGDASRKMLRDYGVWQQKNLYGVKKMGIVRTTYIIDPEGKVRRVFEKVKVDGHIHGVLAAIKG